VLNKLMECLPDVQQSHKRGCPEYNSMYESLKSHIYYHYEMDMGNDCYLDFGEVELTIPYFKMGKCNTVNLFDLDEIILFSFYWHNRDRYKTCLDIGANLGLHSIFMDKCGFNVNCYEPDENHYNELINNIGLNDCNNIKPHKKAVSNHNGIARFIRILDNTTSSHIEGSKEGIYGPTETIEVPTVDINDIVKGIDLVKIDAEGHEDTILEALDIKAFDTMDMVLEVGSVRSAEIIFDKFNGLNVLSQKLGWLPIKTIDDIPTSYKEGSLFISGRFDSFYGN